MTTLPDTHQVRSLMDKYKPAERGFVSDTEQAMILSELQIKDRNAIELENIRDVTVMVYGQTCAAQNDDTDKIMELMDAMSAVTTVIDMEKAKRGLPV